MAFLVREMVGWGDHSPNTRHVTSGMETWLWPRHCDKGDGEGRFRGDRHACGEQQEVARLYSRKAMGSSRQTRTCVLVKEQMQHLAFVNSANQSSA